jgi:hypothetical protein
MLIDAHFFQSIISHVYHPKEEHDAVPRRSSCFLKVDIPKWKVTYFPFDNPIIASYLP